MDIDELKKSWNTIDKHLEKQQIVDNESIKRLIEYASKDIHTMSRFNFRLIVLSLFIIIGLALAFIWSHTMPHFLYIIIFALAIPAFIWDVYSGRYLAKTKIDEMPIATVISRFNKMERWIISERIISVLIFLFVTLIFFFTQRVWENLFSILVFITIFTTSFLVVMWIYRKNLNRLHNIKKNLKELKELKEQE